MKKLFYFIITFVSVLLFSFSSNAQVTANSNFLIGGTLSFKTSNSKVEVTEGGQTTTVDKPESTVFTFEPVVAYFLFPHFAVGGQVSLTNEKITTSTGTDKTNNLLLGPIVRYYVPFLENKAAVFIELDAAFGSSSETILENSTDNTISKFGVGPGLSFFVNDMLGLEAIAKYNYVKSTADVKTDTRDFRQESSSNELNFQIGLQYYFSRKK